MDWFPLYNSLRIAGISTFITFFTGICAAYYISKLPKFSKGVLDCILTLPMVLPPTVVGFFLLMTIGPLGPVGAPVLEIFRRPPDDDVVFRDIRHRDSYIPAHVPHGARRIRRLRPQPHIQRADARAVEHVHLLARHGAELQGRHPCRDGAGLRARARDSATTMDGPATYRAAPRQYRRRSISSGAKATKRSPTNGSSSTSQYRSSSSSRSTCLKTATASPRARPRTIR